MSEFAKKLVVCGIVFIGSIVLLKLIQKQRNIVSNKSSKNIQKKTWIYFGYGSNMSLYHMINVKHIKPLNVIGVGTIKDYKLVFNIALHKNQNIGTGNIMYQKGSYIEGLICEFDEESWMNMVRFEGIYQCVTLSATMNDSGEVIETNVFILDRKHLPMMQERMKSLDLKDNCLVDENYLDTLIIGAKNIGVSKAYIDDVLMSFKRDNKCQKIEHLSRDDVVKCVLNELNQRVWTWDEIKTENNENGGYLTVMKGIVMDGSILSKYDKNSLQYWLSKDTTMSLGKRWAFANEQNTSDISCLEDKQKEYINSIIADMLLKSKTHPGLSFKVVGKLSSNEKWGFDNYSW